jgi:hypothetical protein
MDINSIGSGASTAASTAKRAHRPDGDADDVGANATATSPGMSAIAQDMNQLRTLQQQDPAKFKDVMAQIATAMQSLAQAQPQNGALAKVADDFQQAAQSGQMPAVGGKGGHHHHAHGAKPPAADAAQQPQQASGVSAYTKADRESAWQSAEKAISEVLSKVSQ